MSKEQEALEKLPTKCPLCQARRVGFQEGILYFSCGSEFEYHKDVNSGELIACKRGIECKVG